MWNKDYNLWMQFQQFHRKSQFSFSNPLRSLWLYQDTTDIKFSGYPEQHLTWTENTSRIAILHWQHMKQIFSSKICWHLSTSCSLALVINFKTLECMRNNGNMENKIQCTTFHQDLPFIAISASIYGWIYKRNNILLGGTPETLLCRLRRLAIIWTHIQKNSVDMLPVHAIFRFVP